jgi:hypothetical protein
MKRIKKENNLILQSNDKYIMYYDFLSKQLISNQNLKLETKLTRLTS